MDIKKFFGKFSFLFLLTFFVFVVGFVGDVRGTPYTGASSKTSANPKTYDCTANPTAKYCTPPGSQYNYFTCDSTSGCVQSWPTYSCSGFNSACYESGWNYVIGWQNPESCQASCRRGLSCSNDRTKYCTTARSESPECEYTYSCSYPCQVPCQVITGYGTCRASGGTCSSNSSDNAGGLCVSNLDCGSPGTCNISYTCSNNSSISCTVNTQCPIYGPGMCNSTCSGTCTGYGNCTTWGSYTIRDSSTLVEIDLGCCGTTKIVEDYECDNSCNGTCTLPACPTGYTLTNPNNYCSTDTRTVSCSYNNDCGNACARTATCYREETNQSVSIPTALYLRIQDETYNLSTNENSPTLVRMACNSDVDVTLPFMSTPAFARELGYRFNVNNYGVNGQWSSFGCTRSEDFCIRSTSRTVLFRPNVYTVPDVLREGAKGEIRGSYYTLNFCDDNRRYSPERVGYYEVETNEQPPAPTRINILVDDIVYQLSTDPGSPTTIRYPSTNLGNNVRTRMPILPLPAGASAVGYSYESNNYGINREWIAFGCLRSEDYCSEGLGNNQRFEPTSLGVLEVLKQGAEGQLSGRYFTYNRCGTNQTYSDRLDGYYVVNNNPITNVVFSGDDTTARNCTSNSYTGTEAYNPVDVTITGEDFDSNSEIRGAILWFGKGAARPVLPSITGTYSYSNINEMGIMILKNGATWSNPYIYAYDSVSSSWGRVDDGILRNSDGDRIIRVLSPSVNETSNVTFEFQLEFLTEASNLPSGVYDIGAIVLDEYMVLGDSTVDQSHMQTYFQWGIDLEQPTIGNLLQTVLSAQTLRVEVENLDGTGTDIKGVVLNAYRDGGVSDDLLSLLSPSGYDSIMPGETVPPESEVGHIGSSDGWYLLGDWPANVEMSVGNNEGGTILLYATAFDDACNDTLGATQIDLRPWIASQGGVIYSRGSAGPEAREIDDIGIFRQGVNITLRNYSENDILNRLTTGTELISSRRDVLNRILYSDREVNPVEAVRAMNVYDSNDMKSFWFNYFSNGLEKQRNSLLVTLTDFIVQPGSTAVSQDCAQENCVMYSEGNITIPSGYVCDRNTLIMSEGNINIDPNVTSGSGIAGCIFLAGNNIYIGDGVYRSSASVIGYDYLEGFLIADNQIVIELADIAQQLRDGLEVRGGMVAIGSDTLGDNALLQERNLRLFNHSNPSLVLTWDVRYAKLSELFFAGESILYKQEVGFKVY